MLEKTKIINISEARKNLSKLISRIGREEEVRKLDAYEKENKTAQKVDIDAAIKEMALWYFP